MAFFQKTKCYTVTGHTNVHTDLVAPMTADDTKKDCETNNVDPIIIHIGRKSVSLNILNRIGVLKGSKALKCIVNILLYK